MRSSQAQEVTPVAPQLFPLASAGARHRQEVEAEGSKDDDVAFNAQGSDRLDGSVRPPPKQTQHQLIEPKAAHERPTEVIITTTRLNQNLQHQQIVEVASGTAANTMFGNRGDSGDNAATESAATRSEHLGDRDDHSDVEGWRKPSKHVREIMKQFAQSFPNQNAALLRGKDDLDQ